MLNVENSFRFSELVLAPYHGGSKWGLAHDSWICGYTLLKVDFGSQSHSWVLDFYSTFVKKSSLRSPLLDFSRVNPTVTPQTPGP